MSIEEIKQEFYTEYVNDYNMDETRFLRGVSPDEVWQFIEAQIEQTKQDIIKIMNKPVETHIDYKSMLEAIDELVNTNFVMDMNCKVNIKRNGTYEWIRQKEAREMANIIGQVYLISHAIDCPACSTKWELVSEKDKDV